MVARKKKILAAGAVLAIGLGLAWPLRRTTPEGAGAVRNLTAPAKVFVASATLQRPTAPPLVEAPVPAVTVSALTGAAEPVSHPGEQAPSGRIATADALAPAIVQEQPESPQEPPAERIHVIHNGDTLERLAQRYLGDESRALEIFDLNQDALANPHLLPIGAKLRIPPPSKGGARGGIPD